MWTSPMLSELKHVKVLRTAIAATPQPMELAIARNLDFPLYKATQKRHFDTFMTDGTLRIGTVMDFAREHDLGRAVGDINEGSRTILYTGKHTDVPLAMHLSIVNSYVFCCSKNMTPELIETWKADCCFAINDVRFFYEIAAALAHLASFGIVHEIYYGDWEIDPRVSAWIDAAWPNSGPATGRGRVPPQEAIPRISWLKDADLSYQHEVRAIFEPFTLPGEANQPHFPDDDGAITTEFLADRIAFLAKRGVRADLQPLFIKVPKAREYVSEVSVEEILSKR